MLTIKVSPQVLPSRVSGNRHASTPRPAVAATLALLLFGLSACDNFNQPSQPCAEITAAEFESALSAGETRAEIEVSANGVVSSRIGGSLKTCRQDKTALNREVCRRGRDLVVRYNTAERGIFYIRVPAGRWHRFESRNPPGACRLLP